MTLNFSYEKAVRTDSGVFFIARMKVRHMLPVAILLGCQTFISTQRRDGIQVPSEPLCNCHQGSEICVGKKQRNVDGDIDGKQNEMAIRGKEEAFLGCEPLDDSTRLSGLSRDGL
jgi:hypothetical protein